MRQGLANPTLGQDKVFIGHRPSEFGHLNNSPDNVGVELAELLCGNPVLENVFPANFLDLIPVKEGSGNVK